MAYETVKDFVGDAVPVIDVINPVVEHVTGIAGYDDHLALLLQKKLTDPDRVVFDRIGRLVAIRQVRRVPEIHQGFVR
jgi:phosphoenolpyruvate carboxylase